MSWLRCSACKQDLGFGATHWVCSVSTCNRNNTNYKFCSVACWDSHVATLRHRDAWAVEARGPSREQWAREQADPPAPAPAPRPTAPTPMAATTPRPPAGDPPRRVVAAPPAPASTPAQLDLAPAEREILIVVSKMKKYIKDRSGMNCSDAVAEGLSDHVRAICDEAIRAAATDERKTVLDRDVPRLRR
ncbi:MAG: hypothetical protein HS111_07905 [Kofleriaceae bacterium]|nr:hypothetical protein [Kofleriaceae bacterium]MCL4224716.1 hypothetical protein [Myxococcales bacterium]